MCSNNPILGLLTRVAGVPYSISGPAIYFHCIHVPHSSFFPSTTFNKPIICITLSQINVSNSDFLLNSITHLTNQIKDKHYKIFLGPFDIYIYKKSNMSKVNGTSRQHFFYLCSLKFFRSLSNFEKKN